ncbi:MAG: ribosome biogenesis GTPase YlqF, partial [Clostridia bacterium]
MDKKEKSLTSTSINWYPGHMAKTMKQIEEDLKLVDIVIEILDARIPISSQNPEVQKLIKDKKKIIILNKSDLSDEKQNQNWKQYFAQKNTPAILCNSNSGDGINKIINQIDSMMEEERKKAEQKGRNKIARAMIIGVPNVGKSSFINRISNKTAMQVGNKPGVTKQKQWIRLSNNIELLDTPGVLWPKINKEEVALNLAYTGTIKSEVLDETEIAYNLLKYLISEDRENVINRYNLNIQIIEKILTDETLQENEQIVEIMNYIGEKRGAVLKGNRI